MLSKCSLFVVQSLSCPTLRLPGLQHARLPCPSASPGVCTNSCPLSQWCLPSNHLVLCHPLLLLPSIFPSIRVFSNKSVLCIKWTKYWSFSFSISPSDKYLGLIFFRTDWLIFMLLGDSQESSPTPQFESIGSSMVSFLYGPSLISIHYYWKNHSFDYVDLCRLSDVFAF